MSDWNDNEPIYLQLRNAVVHQILNGVLPEGEVIPSVRLVAKQERINPITVSKAYQMLVDEGLLEKKRGLGMFVGSGAQARALEQERVRFLEDEWPQLRRRLAALQLDLHALVELDDKAGV